MSSNSMVKTSVERSSSLRVIQSGGGCFCFSHHFATGASACSAAKEQSRRTQNMFTFDSPAWKSPDTAEPNRMMLSRFAPAASRARFTKSSIFFSISTPIVFSEFIETIAFSLVTNCCWRRRHPNYRHQSLRSLHRRQNRRLHRRNRHRVRRTSEKKEAKKECFVTA